MHAIFQLILSMEGYLLALAAILFAAFSFFGLKAAILERLGALEWPILVLSLLMVLAESFLSVITSILPTFVIQMFDILTSLIFSIFPSSGINTLLADPELDDIVNNISQAPGFVEMCQLFGYEAEEHIVKTTDGYLLGIHRIGGPKGSNWRMDPPELPRPVVYLHHGLLMNSEVWVANVDPSKCLPFILADLGYDVWLGNNRGNKYSKKHISKHPSSSVFWNFSLDDFALYDIPDTIEYILYIVSQKNLVYIGFSQGSAQAFASLSVNPALNKKVSLFIALAPAMSPPGLRNNFVDALVHASPSLLYLMFGRRAVLKSTTLWQSIMYPPLFVQTLDTFLKFLFNWKGDNISYAQKLAAYTHLYSYTSVKSVVHWFQILKSGRFQMFDDEGGRHKVFVKNKRFYRVASFPTQNIVTPIVLIYGKNDTLVDIDTMVSELPKGTTAIGVEGYEHLDMIWGSDVDTLIFPFIFTALGHIFPDKVVGEVDTDAKKLPQIQEENAETVTVTTQVAADDSAEETLAEDDNASQSTSNTQPPDHEKSKSGSLSHEELARKLAESFSNMGINFGRSAPVVEVIKSHS